MGAPQRTRLPLVRCDFCHVPHFYSQMTSLTRILHVDVTRTHDIPLLGAALPHVITLQLAPPRAGATYEMTNKIASGWRKGEESTVVLGLAYLGAPRELTSKAECERNVPACVPLIFDTAQHHATAFQILLTARALARASTALSSRLQLKRLRVQMLLPPHSLHRILIRPCPRGTSRSHTPTHTV